MIHGAHVLRNLVVSCAQNLGGGWTTLTGRCQLFRGDVLDSVILSLYSQPLTDFPAFSDLTFRLVGLNDMGALGPGIGLPAAAPVEIVPAIQLVPSSIAVGVTSADAKVAAAVYKHEIPVHLLVDDTTRDVAFELVASDSNVGGFVTFMVRPAATPPQ